MSEQQTGIEPGRCPGGAVVEVEVDGTASTGYQVIDLQHAIAFSWATALVTFRAAKDSVTLRVYDGDSGKMLAIVAWKITAVGDAVQAPPALPPGVN